MAEDVEEFVRKRLEEDEVAALGAKSRRWRAVRHQLLELRAGRWWELARLPGADEAYKHAARHDPARVLRQVAAMRAIVEMFESAMEGAKMLPDHKFPGALHHVLRHIASTWSDHPDYDPNWALT